VQFTLRKISLETRALNEKPIIMYPKYMQSSFQVYPYAFLIPNTGEATN